MHGSAAPDSASETPLGTASFLNPGGSIFFICIGRLKVLKSSQICSLTCAVNIHQKFNAIRQYQVHVQLADRKNGTYCVLFFIYIAEDMTGHIKARECLQSAELGNVMTPPYQ